MNGKARINLWMLAAWLVFVCSFAMPAYRGPGLGDLNFGNGNGGGTISPTTSSRQDFNFESGAAKMAFSEPSLSGWSAMQAAFDENGYAVLSASTNLLMVLMVLSVWSRLFAKWFCWILGLACLFNLWWIQALGTDAHNLSAGYYVWVVSFALAAVGLYQRSHDAERSMGPSPESQNLV